MDVLFTHLQQLQEEKNREARLQQMTYMWRDGLPILFHSILIEEEDISLQHLNEFISVLGLDALLSLRTKKVFMTVGGFRIPMAGKRTALHIAVEHGKSEVVAFLKEKQFPSVEDEYGILPEDLDTHSSSPHRNTKILQAVQKQLAEKPSADSFREPFLQSYPSYPLSFHSVEPVFEKDIVLFPNFLTSDTRELLIDLYRFYKSNTNIAPNTMSKKGYSLRGTRLETLGYDLSKKLGPFAKYLGLPEPTYPEIAHAFFVSYDKDASTLDKHRDGGFWTANLCLKSENCDQDLVFGERRLKMEEGLLVLHKGCVEHSVEGTCEGERINLVLWFY